MERVEVRIKIREGKSAKIKSKSRFSKVDHVRLKIELDTGKILYSCESAKYFNNMFNDDSDTIHFFIVESEVDNDGIAVGEINVDLKYIIKDRIVTFEYVDEFKKLVDEALKNI